jgi:hypothetical protein
MEIDSLELVWMSEGRRFYGKVLVDWPDCQEQAHWMIPKKYSRLQLPGSCLKGRVL